MDFYNAAGSDETNSTTHQLFSEQFRDVPVTLPANRWLATNHESPINSMGVVYEGNYLITGNEKGDVSIWDIATGHVFRTLTQFKGTYNHLLYSVPRTSLLTLHTSRCHIHQNPPTFWLHIIDLQRPINDRTKNHQKAPLRRSPRLSLHDNRPSRLHSNYQIQRPDPRNILLVSCP